MAAIRASETISVRPSEHRSLGAKLWLKETPEFAEFTVRPRPFALGWKNRVMRSSISATLGKAWRSLGSPTPDTAPWGCSTDIPVWRDGDRYSERGEFVKPTT